MSMMGSLHSYTSGTIGCCIPVPMGAAWVAVAVCKWIAVYFTIITTTSSKSLFMVQFSDNTDNTENTETNASNQNAD